AFDPNDNDHRTRLAAQITDAKNIAAHSVDYENAITAAYDALDNDRKNVVDGATGAFDPNDNDHRTRLAAQITDAKNHAVASVAQTAKLNDAETKFKQLQTAIGLENNFNINGDINNQADTMITRVNGITTQIAAIKTHLDTTLYVVDNLALGGHVFSPTTPGDLVVLAAKVGEAKNDAQNTDAAVRATTLTQINNALDAVNKKVGGFNAANTDKRNDLVNAVEDTVNRLQTSEDKFKEIQTTGGLAGDFDINGNLNDQTDAIKTRIEAFTTKLTEIKGLLNGTDYAIPDASWTANNAFSPVTLDDLTILYNRLSQAKDNNAFTAGDAVAMPH
ncbi:MAG: hypothetical protein AAF320_01750, partial [Myxococcota bacterium]